MRLKGKAAVLTGAAGGIGLALLLASNDALYIRGETIDPDRGRLALNSAVLIAGWAQAGAGRRA